MDGPLPWDATEISWRLLFAFFLVFLNGFFVAAEFSIVKVRTTRIATIRTSRGRAAQRVVGSLDTYLSVAQVGITLASLGFGWATEDVVRRLSESAFAHLGVLPHPWFDWVPLTVAFLMVTFIHIVLGELVPKSLAIAKSEEVALWTAGPMHGIYRIIHPFVVFLNGSANLVLRMLRIQSPDPSKHAHTEEELRMMFTQRHQSGLIDQSELKLFDNVFEFTERIAREVMVPRVNMVCLFADRPFVENFSIIKNARHTRFPLCGRDKDDILGIVHIRDVYERLSDGEQAPNLTELARPNVVVPETLELKDILRDLQKNRVEMAIVLDEFGGTSGLVTTEDIIEEIFGEIQDEFDDEMPLFQRRGDDTLIDARLLIEDVNQHFCITIEDEDNDTIGGWLFSRLAKLPEEGDEVRFGPWSFCVEEVDQLRIKRILVKPIPPALPPGDVKASSKEGGDKQETKKKETTGD